MHEVLVNRLGGLSLPRKSVVRLTDRPDMTLDVYRGRKTTAQQQYIEMVYCVYSLESPRWGNLMRTLKHTFMLKKIVKIPIMPPDLAL